MRQGLAFWALLIPVTGYRLIPDRIRGMLGGRSSSLRAVEGLWRGEGLRAVTHAIKPGWRPDL
jgi:hypothetical protein